MFFAHTLSLMLSLFAGLTQRMPAIKADRCCAPVPFKTFARTLAGSCRRYEIDRTVFQPLMGGSFQIRADPKPTCVASCAESRQRVIGADTFVGVDNAGVFTDEQRAVVAQLCGQRVRVGSMHLEVLRCNVVRIADHRIFIDTENNLTVVHPAFARRCGS